MQVAVGADQVDRFGAHVLDRRQPEPHAAGAVDREVGAREIDVRRQHLDVARLAVDDGRGHIVGVARVMTQQ